MTDILQAPAIPYDAPGIAVFVDLHDAQGMDGIRFHVAEILSAAGGDEILTCQILRLCPVAECNRVPCGLPGGRGRVPLDGSRRRGHCQSHQREIRRAVIKYLLRELIPLIQKCFIQHHIKVLGIVCKKRKLNSVWIYCPYCGRKTRSKLLSQSILRYCPVYYWYTLLMDSSSIPAS